MKKELICFDLDGTLVDNSRAHAVAYNLAFRKNNLRTYPENKIIAALGVGKRQLIRKLQPRISPRKFKAVMEDHTKFLIENCKLMKPIPGVVDALVKLKRKYRLGLVSNNIKENILEILECCKIKPKIFDVVVGEDEAKAPKPAPYEILKAEKIVKANAEYMVGDTIYDIRAGKRAGAKTIAVLTGVHSIEQLWKEGPTMVVRSVAVLPDILL